MECRVCHHKCIIDKGHPLGRCGAYGLIDNEVVSLNARALLAKALDPIEKKPLFHFYPGRTILSIGSFGCNLKCPWCQNRDLVQARAQVANQLLGLKGRPSLQELFDLLVDEALGHQALGIAFTYSEPLVWLDTVVPLARHFKQRGLKTVMVTNGCAAEPIIRKLIPWIDAWNVDLKCVTEAGYEEIGGSLAATLKTIQLLTEAQQHVEVTYLIVPGFNDTRSDFIRLGEVAKTLGIQVLHLTRYHPTPYFDVEATPEETMTLAYDYLYDKIPFVYLGNCSWADIDTYCPQCGERLVQRSLRPVVVYGHQCLNCGMTIPMYNSH